MVVARLKNELFKKSEFKKHFLSAFWGTALGQLILVAASPIISRIYSPEEFGMFSILFGYLTILSAVSTGRYELAIILPKSNKAAINIAMLALTVAGCVSAVVVAALFFIPETFFVNNGIPHSSSLIYIAPVFIMSVALYQSAYCYHIRTKLFTRNSQGKVINSTTTSLFSVGIGLVYPLGNVLLIGKSLGFFIASLYLIFSKEVKKVIRYIRLRYMIMMMKRYSDFPKYSVLGTGVDKLGAQLPILLINSLYTSEMAGYYAFALNVIYVPMSFISIAVSDVFRQKISEKVNNGLPIKEDYIKMINILALISFLPLLLFGIISPTFFKIIFGKEWETAGLLIRPVLPMLFFRFIYSPVSGLFIVLEKQKVYFYWQLSFVFLTYLVFIIGKAMFESIYYVLFGYTILYGIMAMINMYMGVKYSKKAHNNEK